MSLIPNLDSQRWLILWGWFACLIVNLGLILYLDSSEYRVIDSPPEGWRDPINKAYEDLIGVYAPPLTTMLAIGFARKPSPPPRIRPGARFAAAILSSLAWNGVLTLQNLRLSLFHTLDIQSFAIFLPTLPRLLSFLVTPILAFYFSSEQS